MTKSTPEKIAYMRAWRKSLTGQKKIADYYVRNKEQWKINRKKYNDKLKRENPEKYKKLLLRRRVKDRRAKHRRPNLIYGILKNRMNELKLPLTSIELFIGWYNSQKRICHYCERPENECLNRKGLPVHRLNVARKDVLKGGLLDNLVLACYRCTNIKSNLKQKRIPIKDTYNEMKQNWRKYWADLGYTIELKKGDQSEISKRKNKKT